ncbi:class I SAM-dependent methyltransferase [Acidobacteriota bacterium]
MNKQLRFYLNLIAVGILLVIVIPVFPQNTADDEAVWESFKDWVMTISGQVSLKAYNEKLTKDGMSEVEIKRQLKVIQRFFKEQPEKGIEITYDRIFSKPLTGDPEKDGFTSTPSVFMTESTKELKPGTALDVGAGQGRNAVWLAQQGWDVTGIDLSAIGLAAAEANAEQLGLRIKTVKTTYQEYDFGIERWDLIIMILSWAPVSDPDFVSRLSASLRLGGVVVFEHVLDTEKQSFPPYVQAIPPNALLDHFKDFHIQKYEESVWQGDWGGPPAELVRMIARKK